MPAGVVVAVAGAKGGVGKTTTTINLGAVLADMGHSVVLVEFDVAMANVGDFLDLEVDFEDARDPTLHEVLAGTANVADAIYEAPGGFDVVPSGTTLEGFANVDVGRAGAVLTAVRSRYDVVLLDTGAGIGAETLVPLSLADETVLVSSPRVASVRDAKKTRNLVRQVDGTVAGVVFVKSGSGRSPGVERIADFLAVDLLGHVPEDAAVAAAQDIGRPVVVADGDSDAARAYGALGSRMHERVKTLQAASVAAENGAATADPPASGSDTGSADRQPGGADSTEALSTAEEGTDGFAFVDGTTADGASEPAETGRANADATRTGGTDTGSSGSLDQPPVVAGGQPAGSSGSERAGTHRGRQKRSERDDSGPDSGGAKPRERAGRTRVQRPGRRTSNGATGAGGRVGATDDEIAEQLASVEVDEAERAKPEAQAGEQSASDDGGTVTEPAEREEPTEEQGERTDGSWESKQSTAKRFIDRAIEIVDRRGD
ncbi:AAA family ATPase [Salinigranum marinum]|uniref:AAA family ATPase n=1 Tax=Salinigranum marinum TaxID=1515595 RepID=UPI002989F6C1|nr:P-loop NTPase [Salinigranum marinum]